MGTHRRKPLAVLILGVILNGVLLSAAADEAGPHPTADGLQTIDPRVEALHLIDTGKRAMVDSNATPARAVDAALALVKALHYFQQTSDTDRICDLEADIFWCKKRMNVEELKAFLAAKGGGAQDAKLIADADAIVDRKVTVADAQGYVDRAAAFEREHPGDLAGIATRYFEIAERFPNSDIGTSAQKRSLDAQKRLQAALQAERAALYETIFTRPAAPPAAGRLAVPDADALRVATTELRKRFKADYAIHRATHKRHFSALLAKAAAEASSPAPQRYAQFEEAATLSLEAKDYDVVLTLADAMAASFDIGAREQKLLWLSRDHGNPIAAAIIKLIDAPADKDANFIVGKYLCLDQHQWDSGIPILIRGSDPALKTVAEMELLKPEGAMQQLELADHWCEMGSKSFGPAKEQLMGRSFYWYGLAKPGLSGITKERIAKKMEEVADAVPCALFNFEENLSIKQWERIPGRIIEVPATRERIDTGTTLSRGMRARIVRKPGETWSMSYREYNWKVGPNVFDSDTWGYDPLIKGWRTLNVPDPKAIGALIMCIDQGPATYAGYLIGEESAAVIPYTSATGWGLSGIGHIRAGCNLPGSGSGKGLAHIKVFIEEDD